MTKLALSPVLVAMLVGAAMPAQAQLARTFVSAASGSDANNCDRPTPCRTFQGAHDKTNTDGEIVVLDPGGYGAVTINKSISIVNDGVGEASILVSGGSTGITVNGGPATNVNLRGITVQGIGFGADFGLFFNSGLSLTITRCVFRNQSREGIIFAPSVGGASNLSISDTLVADNGSEGILIFPAASGVAVRVAVDRVQILNNGQDGFELAGNSSTGTIDAAVTDSLVANNRASGVRVSSGNDTAATSLLLNGSVVANNATGLEVVPASMARLRVSRSGITGNARTWSLGFSGVLQSLGDNYIVGNADGDPAPPTIARK